MTTTSQSTKRKLSLLQLAEARGNVAKARRIMGYHRDTFYEVQKAFEVGGVAALIEARRDPCSVHPNRVPQAVEQQILDLRLKAAPLRQPAHRQRAAATGRWMPVLPESRGVWFHQDLEIRHKRLLRLEA